MWRATGRLLFDLPSSTFHFPSSILLMAVIFIIVCRIHGKSDFHATLTH